MREPRSYIVRVYRQGARNLIGIVEDTRTGGQRNFCNVQELWTLLRRPLAGPPSARAEREKT